MTPGRLWWLLRRDWNRGFSATWADYILRPRIWRWRNPYAGQPVQAVPVHLLCGHEHLDMAAWMLASWTTATARNWAITLHDDGSLAADAGRRLASLGLAVRLIRRTEADAAMAPMLTSHPRCAAYRRRHPLALKIFDSPQFADGNRFLLLDTDLVFFHSPDEIMDWTARADDVSCWFNADLAESSNVSPAEARRVLGVDLWPKVNSGLCLLRRGIVDLDFCERILNETTIEQGHIWRIEQTLFSLCASRGSGGLLPARYEVSLGPRMQPGAVARHYVGAVRDRFYAEGVRRSHRELFAR